MRITVTEKERQPKKERETVRKNERWETLTKAKAYNLCNNYIDLDWMMWIGMSAEDTSVHVLVPTELTLISHILVLKYPLRFSSLNFRFGHLFRLSWSEGRTQMAIILVRMCSAEFQKKLYIKTNKTMESLNYSLNSDSINSSHSSNYASNSSDYTIQYWIYIINCLVRFIANYYHFHYSGGHSTLDSQRDRITIG
jgi:hypothetical protein